MSTESSASANTPAGFLHRRVGKRSELLVEAALVLCASVAIIATIGIVVVLATESAPFFAEVSLSEFLGDTQWTPLFADNQHFGIWPLVAGTMVTSAIALSVAIPFGIFAAVYLSEYARPGVRAWLKPMLEVLAGIPTVVYGFFALTVVTPALQSVFPGVSGFNALAPGLVMGIMIIPLVASLSEDAIFAVPRSLREASLALGGAKSTTIWRVVLPSARSGISAAIIIAASRAIGETMIVAIAAGQSARLGVDPREPMQTMTAFIADISKGDLPTGSLSYQSIFAVGVALFAFTLTLNIISYRWSRAMRAQARAV